jgi:hypothetical protein
MLLNKLIPFKPITVDDREAITSFTFGSSYMNCDFSFANMCSWRFLYKSEFAIENNFLLIRFWLEDHKRPVYMCPVGEGNLTDSVNLLEQDSLEFGHPLWILGVTPTGKEHLDEAFPGGFRYMPERNYNDYIYLREDLVNLTGKKYQAKRNHINKFTKLYRYEYMPITPRLVPECLELEKKWYKANHTEQDAEYLSYERRSMTFALQHSSKLGLIGGAICADHRIVAFSFGAPINKDTFGVHVEKADINYEGAYSLINREFAVHIPEQYIYVNREEDLGIEGLRKAKLSYQPTIILEKHTAVKKR